MDEIVEEFLVESYENLDRLDADLLALEQDPTRPDLLASVFRSIHTIKGTCGFLGFEKLERVTHVGESLLSRLRDGQLALNPAIATALLSLVDAVRLMLASVEANGTDGDGDWSDLVARLEALQQGDGAAAGDEAADATVPATAAPEAPVVDAVAAVPDGANAATIAAPEAPVVDEDEAAVVGEDEAPATPEVAAAPDGTAAATIATPETPVVGEDEAATVTEGATVAAVAAASATVATAGTAPAPVLLAGAGAGSGDQASSRASVPNGTPGNAQHPANGTPGNAQRPANGTPGNAPHPANGTAGEAGGTGDRLGEILVAAGSATPDAVTLANLAQQVGDARRIGEVLVDHGATTQEDVHEALQAQKEQRGSVSDSSVRVDVGLLDDLMNLVSELVLARNQILQHSGEGDTLSTGTFQRLNLITTELQEAVMKTRMQPIRNVWSKFPRVVRDLSMACGKQIRVEMEGEHTELDKTIIEAIRDPLTHVIRNAVDHGVETPDARVAAGKPAEGRLRLRAFHESGQVNIEVSDDGGGIDPERVRAKAVERGLLTEAHSRQLGERELVNLIFSPGFSTAEQVTNVSGRGVGMDVVKTNIEKIGGTVDIQSELGRGTTLKVKIPLTLAIIPALIVTCAEERYAIPQVNLVELVRIEADQAAHAVEDIHGAPVYRLRGRLLPLVYLDKTLGVATGSDQRSAVSIVVLQVDDRTFGLVVDDVNDTEEIVVKALGRHVKGIPSFAGATIMGDGRVALILDVLGLARQGHVVGEQRSDAAAQSALLGETQHGEDTTSLLLVASADRRRTLAIPLVEVARLEEFPGDALETAGRHAVVRYGEHILPLVDLFAMVGAGGGPLTGRAQLNVVVHGAGASSVGLVVDEVVDIVQEHVDVQGAGGGPAGLAGAAIIRGGVADLVDIERIVAEAGIADLVGAGSEVVA